MPHHILFLIDVLYIRQAGTEGVLWRITRNLPRERFRCSIATFASRPEKVAREAFDCPVHLLPVRRLYGTGAIRAAIRLARLIRSEQVSLVHTFFPASDLLGGLVAKLCGCPVISSRRDTGFDRTGWQRLAYRAVGGIYDQVQAVSEQVRLAHLRADGLDPAKTVTIYNGVDLEEIDRAPVSEPIPGNRESPVIACVTNIRRIKGVEVFLHAVDKVRRAAPQARFLVVGGVVDRQCYSELLELARQLALSDTVTFFGPSTAVHSLLKGCRIFCLPSHSEGLSNALLEAMACGLPCVATEVGGTPEIIVNGRNGLLVPAGDPDALAEGILALLQDADLARRLGCAARRTVEQRFSLSAMIERLVAEYQRLLGGSTATRTDLVPYAACRESGLPAGGVRS